MQILHGASPGRKPKSWSRRRSRVKTTTCYMCACRCGIRVHLRDGEVRYIDGNPRPPAEQGRDLRQGLVGHHEAVFAGAAD
jgi:anaerobic selenocysteine-containing dehydrogenase